jgi:hypothetical protein
MSSLSCCPIPQMKKRLAYRLYTILESADAAEHQNKKRRRPSRRRDGRTFVLEEVAHARSPGQHELCDVLYNLGCRTGRGIDEGGRNVSTGRGLRRAFAPPVTSAPLLRGDMVVYHFARRTLPCREMRRKKDKPVSSRQTRPSIATAYARRADL